MFVCLLFVAAAAIVVVPIASSSYVVQGRKMLA